MYQQLGANVRCWTTKESSRDVVTDSHSHHSDVHRKGSMPEQIMQQKGQQVAIDIVKKGKKKRFQGLGVCGKRAAI